MKKLTKKKFLTMLILILAILLITLMVTKICSCQIFNYCGASQIPGQMKVKIMELIDWCNKNEGFLTLISIILASIISVLTIRLSWQIGKIPFSKKASVTVFCWKPDNEYRLRITIVNIGMAPLNIKSIDVIDNDGYILGSVEKIFSKFKGALLIEGNGIFSTKIKVINENQIFEKHAIDLNNHIKVVIREHDGNVYTISKGFPVG